MSSSCYKENKYVNADSIKVKRDVKPVNIGGYMILSFQEHAEF